MLSEHHRLSMMAMFSVTSQGHMLDLITLSKYTAFIAQHPEFMSGITSAQWLFFSELLEQVSTPYMRSQLKGCPQLQTLIRETMRRCALTKPST